jgi:hypothetical protein
VLVDVGVPAFAGVPAHTGLSLLKKITMNIIRFSGSCYQADHIFCNRNIDNRAGELEKLSYYLIGLSPKYIE